MKSIVLVSILLTTINCLAQDSANVSLSKSSFSISGGINLTYPTVSNFIDYGEVTPITCLQPWETISYSFLLHNSNCLGIKLEIGDLQFRYNGILQAPSTISILTLQQINKIELSTGPFLITALSKRIGWYNELGLTGEVVVYYLYNPNHTSFNGDIRAQDFTDEADFSLYFYYTTGIVLKLDKNLRLIPHCTFSLLNITTLLEKNRLPHENAYNNLRTGITLIYAFNKK